ncbi:haloacid dehalogenase type II [Marivibrio halodurans]|uniref:(S)-2-haloacid dehalogenase n=1 Tax=Marivibrio halodurans TaxID=2039722 RepID=A0A8J7SGT2_9PROT|nr:haloacid dehalogenase type II [Marivibrio halodurans]MBP5855923.1 haloacid dehalogenase type II [Marivibrio halodurans]
MTDLPEIHGARACVFDAYGTLFDVHSAVGAMKAEIGPQADRLSQLWRQKQLEYTWLRSLMRAHRDFWSLTGDGLDFAMEATGLGDRPELRERLMDLYLRLDCYPEAPATLDRLRASGMATAILSNGAPAMLESAVTHAGLADRLDPILSVEDIGIFKPDPRTYQLACDRLGLAADAVCFLSSNAWDVAGAAHFGFQVVWINRFGLPRERLPGTPRAVIERLDELPALVGA